MTNSTIPAESLGAPPVSASYYRWAVPEKPIEVHLNLDLMERLERDVLEAFKAITRRGSEIGGVLVGRTVPGTPATVVIEQFEPVECEYSRGPLYLLADNDKVKLQQAIERAGKLGDGLSAVGFFRSNTRRELVLDEDDLAIAAEHFSGASQVLLLVRPFAMKPSLGGFFIWENGQLDEACSLQFPFKRAELMKTQAASIIGAAGAPAAPKEPLVMPKREDRAPAAAPVAPPAALKREEPRPAAPAAPPKREEAPPLTFKREEHPPIIPSSLKREETRREERPPIVPVQPKRDERPAGPTLVTKREEPPAPAAAKIEQKKEEKPAALPKREEKPAITVKREEKPAVTPAPPKRETAALKAEEKPAPAKRPEVAAAPAITEAQEKAEPQPDLTSLFRGTSFAEPEPGEKSGLIKWVLIGLLGLLVAGGGGYLAFNMGKSQQQEVAQAVDSSLALKVERNTGQLLLSWNRAASVIGTATKATLVIADGDHKEPVDLDLGQLRTGSIAYSPITNDVNFRLELTDKSGKTVGESVRVLAGRPSPTVSAQPPAAAAKPAPGAGDKAGAQTPAAQPPASTPAPPPEEAKVVAGPAVTTSLPKPESLAARLRAAEPQEMPAPPTLESGSTNAIAAAAPTAAPTQMAPPPVAQPAPAPAPKPAAQAPAAVPAQAPAVPVKPAGGRAQEARLVRSVAPVYPPLARQTRVSGIVRVRALIGKDGKVKQATAAAGPPLLRQAAADAVRRWIYSPAMLNGAPVESETQVDVNFMM
ncbi:MAG TPA: energy transducer TonB [Bryobacteraceae bacterium]